MTKPVSIDVRLNCVTATLRTILATLTASDANGQDHDVSNAVVAMRPVLDELQAIHEHLDAISMACGGLLWDNETPTASTKPDAPAKPEVPINPLCNNDDPSDVISAAQSVLRFLHSAKGTENDERDEQFTDGRQWMWGMAHDALSYAQELTHPKVRS